MGAGINEMFSDNPQDNLFGFVTGSPTAVQLPSGSCKLLRFKADPDNLGTVLLGWWGAGDPTYPLDAGDDTGWIAPPSADGNTRGLHNYSCSMVSGTSDYLHWWIQR